MQRQNAAGVETREFWSIQYLRGLAATMVVIYHLGQPLARMGYSGGWPAGLSAGVDIFFVISGFVMWVTTRARPLSPLQFYRKRIVRIVPLYWIMTSVMLAILLAAPSVMQTSVFQFRHVVASYFFFPVKNPGKEAMEPLLFAGWTLNYEMLFYAIFGLFLMARPTVRLWGTLAVLVGLVALGSLAGATKLSAFGFYTSDILLEFAAGMLIGELTLHRNGAIVSSIPLALALSLFVVGLAILLWSPIPPELTRAVCYGLASAAIVLGALAIELRGKLPQLRLARLVGDASYSIYLSQLMTMAAFFFAWKRLRLTALPGATLLFSILDVLVALTGGIACYFLIERPLISLFRRRRAAPVTVPIAA
jgi:peptidoglycan/LPS O-acetylase OafA/YrhL